MLHFLRLWWREKILGRTFLISRDFTEDGYIEVVRKWRRGGSSKIVSVKTESAVSQKKLTMKRDWRLIRLLLLVHRGPRPISESISQWSREEIGYHVELLKDAKLINGCSLTRGGPFPGTIVFGVLTDEGEQMAIAFADKRTFEAALQRLDRLNIGACTPLLLDVIRDEAEKR